MDPLDFAIVLVARNRAPMMLRALVALAACESGPSFETVAVDDGSSDATAAIFDAIEGDFVGLREDASRGFARGCDRAIAASAARTIVIMREDLVATDGWLEAIQAAFADPDAGAILPRVIDWRGRDISDPGWPCLAVRRRALAQVGGLTGPSVPGRPVKQTLIESVRSAGWTVRPEQQSVLLALPDTLAEA